MKNMRCAAILLAGMMALTAAVGCSRPAPETKAPETQAETTHETEPMNQAEIDQAAADAVAELIDAIYVQTRNEHTDEQCAAAKAAWDALTDEQKELVEGEEADPDYFGRDTGDASLDDPLNADEIGENEILVVSFGTSFNDSRAKDISSIEKYLQAAFPDWSVRRAFTAQIIINHVQARDGEKIDNMEQALERAIANGVKNLVVQPTHLMHGAEYDELMEALEAVSDQFESVIVSEPLLGAPIDGVNEDQLRVAETIMNAALKTDGYKSAEEAAEDGTAYVFMGHGTSHTAKVAYTRMTEAMEQLEYANAFIGTVEGEPEETEVMNVMDAVAEAGYTRVVLRPLMVVAGDHANNDMAGEDEDSWKSLFEAFGDFDEIVCQIEGLGRICGDIYLDHILAAMTEGGAAVDAASAKALAAASKAIEVADGEYTAEFDSDSGMFHVNEAYDDCGTLTVKDGEMVFHLVLPSKNIVQLALGTIADIDAGKAQILEPTVEKVTYKDGTSEEVHAFDVPVPALGAEFDLALIGTKGKWYDHKVSITPIEE